MQKNTKVITMLACFLVCAITVTASIGTTLAFYSGGGDLKNNLATKESSLYLEEVFDPNDKWLPGETKAKKVHFGNDGESSQVIRFKVVLEWLDKDNNKWTPTTASPVEIKWTTNLAAEWDNSFLGSNGWYYYRKILPAGQETNAVMESVTFSPGLSDDFASTTYRIKIYMEGVDVSPEITKAEWDKMTFTESAGTLTWSVAP